MRSWKKRLPLGILGFLWILGILTIGGVGYLGKIAQEYGDKIGTFIRRPPADIPIPPAGGSGCKGDALEGCVGGTRGASLEREKPIRFAVLSDIHNDTTSLSKALGKIQAEGYEFVIVTGDLTSVGTKKELLTVKKTLDSSGVQYYAIPGNHDLWTEGRTGENLFEQVFGKSYQAVDVPEGLEGIGGLERGAVTRTGTTEFLRRPPADSRLNRDAGETALGTENNDGGLIRRRLPDGEAVALGTGNVRLILINNGDWKGIGRKAAEVSQVPQVPQAETGIGTTGIIRRPLASPSTSLRVNSEGDVFGNGDDGEGQWGWIEDELADCPKITCLVFGHMPVNHPSSVHIMGENSTQTASQAAELVRLLVENKVKHYFSGHLHFASEYNLDGLATSVTGAITSERNWQTSRFLGVTVQEGKVTTQVVEVGE